MKHFLSIILIFVFSPIFSQVKSPQSYENDPLYIFIQNWWEAPYKYGGESRYGIDCSAFTSKLIDQVYKVKLPRTAQEQYKTTKRIEVNDLKDGDLVFFRTKVKSGWHVGVYLTDGYFIHAKSRKGVSINNLSESNYKRIFYGAGRVNENLN